VGDQFLTVSVKDILVGEPLPTSLYIYIDFRFITFRAEGDVLDRMTYDRLFFKKVQNLFIKEDGRASWDAWIGKRMEEETKIPSLPAENKAFPKVRDDVHRRTMDIFQSNHPDKIVSQTMASSKKLVTEVMKMPFAVHPLSMLQGYSKGTVDHSVNVSVLSVYLAMQMGYTHTLILQHVGSGGLLHDLGKTRVPIQDGDSKNVVEKKMQEHPTLGLRIIESQSQVPNEVKMIIAQHHECHDGSGFPKKLRGSAIYDLARIVSIANVFDGLVSDGKGTLVERQRHAIMQLDQVQYKKFDPQKLDKALKILKLGV
jgi:putative nucleotidyltransferase with HDIG domain